MTPTPKIVFLDASSLSDLPAFDRLNEVGDFTSYDLTEPSEVPERAADAQVIITNKLEITAEVIEQLPELKLICVSATGTNNVDHKAAEKRNIPVRNVAGYSTDSVAQLTLTAYFTVAMDLLHLNELVYNGAYSKARDFTMWRHPFHELPGKRFGIIGLGAIGQRVAELAACYGAEVVYHSISGSDHDVPYRRVDLEELLTTSDVVSIHCALSDDTRHLIGYAELERMKSTAYLINMARGGIVVEADLARAIDAREIAGAAVDTFSTEPLPDDHPYLGVKQREHLLLTPHVAWASVEARTRLIDGVIENIKAGW
ncbi:glycerate dehydrogenase [Lewinella marina]|uniref:Hydroxyacid dehydrogenase n=1 Tax=Neolewinella marina TaxID=438751 RepID=A0A2G0CG91_9BACT|nr:NAD(P)-dependent oxidoreductase [Neolewinella marina]NJB86556.1 glycerate dehydrogenase [Neolewinella marina]PHK98991.1 hydroxyacid dehydrogenase [Neolewinella marina]